MSEPPTETGTVATLDRETAPLKEPHAAVDTEQGKPTRRKVQRPETGKAGHDEDELSADIKNKIINTRYAKLPDVVRQEIEKLGLTHDMRELMGLCLFTKDPDMNDPILLEAAKKQKDQPILDTGIRIMERQLKDELEQEIAEFAADDPAHAEHTPDRSSKITEPDEGGHKDETHKDETKEHDVPDQEEIELARKAHEAYEAFRKDPLDVDLQHKMHEVLMEEREHHARKGKHGAEGLKKKDRPVKHFLHTTLGVSFYLILLSQYLVAEAVNKGAGGK